MSGSRNWYIYIEEYYLAVRKDKILQPAAVWIDLKKVLLTDDSGGAEQMHSDLSDVG